MATQPAVASVEAPRGDSGAPRAGGSHINKYLVVLAVMPSAIMEILDTSVVNVSLPHISGSLGSSVNEATWVLTSYLIANAIMVPLGGWLSHHFGRKRLLLTVVTGFTLSSVLCGLAPTLPLLVLFRVLQGLTGGGLQPLSQSILFEEFPVHERQRAMSIWAFGVVLAPILGPTVGGWITDTWTWRYVFFINVPIGILSWMLISAFVRDPHYLRDGKAAKVDGMGLVLLAFGMAALQAMFDKGEQKDWFSSHLIVALAIVAVVLIPLFVIRELRAPNPFVKIRLFTDWNFGWGSFIGFLMYSTLFGSIILVPLFMETVLGWTAVTTGIWTAPRGLGSLCGIAFQWIPGFKKIKGSSWMAVTGFAVTGVVFVTGYAHMDMHSGTWDLFWPQCIQGFAVTLAFMPIVVGAMAHIKSADMPYATSLYGTIRNIGSSAGISFVAIFLDRRNQFHQSVLAANAFPGNPALTRAIGGLRSVFMLHGADVHLAGREAIAALYRQLLAQANLLSFLDSFRLFGIVLLAVAFVPLVLKRTPHK